MSGWLSAFTQRNGEWVPPPLLSPSSRFDSLGGASGGNRDDGGRFSVVGKDEEGREMVKLGRILLLRRVASSIGIRVPKCST